MRISDWSSDVCSSDLKPVALLAQTIGPFNEATEHYFRRSMENVAICTVRESESLRYLQSLIPDVRVEQTADVAFLLPVTPPEEARHILEVEHHFPIAGRRLVDRKSTRLNSSH